MGRFVNRAYRNYSLFISEAASLFNIHSSPRIIPFAFPGDIVPTATFAGERSSPLLANARLFDIGLKAASVPPSAPAGHLPREGKVYLGRLFNRPYRNYSLFISEAASLFNIHSFQRIIPLASRQYSFTHSSQLHRRGELRSPVLRIIPETPCR